MEVFEYYKSFEHKTSKGKYTRFFLRLAGIAVGYLNRKVYLFSMRNLEQSSIVALDLLVPLQN